MTKFTEEDLLAFSKGFFRDEAKHFAGHFPEYVNCDRCLRVDDFLAINGIDLVSSNDPNFDRGAVLSEESGYTLYVVYR